MKINPLFSAVNFLGKLTERDGNGQEAYSQSPEEQAEKDKKKKNSYGAAPKALEVIEVTDEKVQNAMESFNKEESTISAGLSLATEGQIPGLKILLKDVSGNVVRKFTAEEFIRLRDTSTQDYRSRGKILDQKL